MLAGAQWSLPQGNMGRSIFLSAPPLRMAGFCKGGFGFCLQRSRQNLDPSENFFKGADKQSTLRTSFFKGQ